MTTIQDPQLRAAVQNAVGELRTELYWTARNSQISKREQATAPARVKALLEQARAARPKGSHLRVQDAVDLYEKKLSAQAAAAEKNPNLTALFSAYARERSVEHSRYWTHDGLFPAGGPEVEIGDVEFEHYVQTHGEGTVSLQQGLRNVLEYIAKSRDESSLYNYLKQTMTDDFSLSIPERDVLLAFNRVMRSGVVRLDPEPQDGKYAFVVTLRDPSEMMAPPLGATFWVDQSSGAVELIEIAD